MMTQIQYIKNATLLTEKSISNTLNLLEEGATIPFIARYRKEATNGLDELEIGAIRDANKKYEEIENRKKTILKSIEEQGKLNPELKQKINDTFDLTLLEDLYLPYKQKRLTRGEKAKKLGLEPLAKIIMSQRGGNLDRIVETYIKGDVETEEMAIQGAQDIISEWVNENTTMRQRIRQLFQKKGILQTKVNKGKEEAGDKFKDYFSLSEPLYRMSSHRFLASYRAEREGFIQWKVNPETEEALEILNRYFIKSNDEFAAIVEEAIKDAYKRLMTPSIETEVLNEAKEKADKEAILIFAKNLRQLLLAPPLGAKRILAIDPGFRTGCKVVCIDESGDLLTNATIYPHPPQNESKQAQAKLAQLVEAYKIDALAIGDGTAGRETENLVKHIRFNRDVEVYIVREDGASIYSASAVARKEFPSHDVTVRGAVSIGRRLMDPLAELVKIDPKSVGVGQYQHEVNQNLLKDSLDDVVFSCVNNVGVDLNTASPYLLAYVSGLSLGLAENIVNHRTEIGGFKSREELKKVKRLGDKAFEQAAGFLRISNAENPLDNSAVHPESYKWVQKMAARIKVDTKTLIGNKTLVEQIKAEDFKEIDPFTFKDLLSELKKPSRDPRKHAQLFEFDHTLKTIDNVKIGQKIPGIITNVTAFGAFVNIGIKENGLIHKSNLSDQYIEDPSSIVSLHQHVEVEVIELDVARKRIGLKLIH